MLDGDRPRLDGSSSPAEVVPAQGPRIWFPALDGLRGLAALWVLIGHIVQRTPLNNRLLWLPINNGLAVDMFILLTGFLMYSLHRRDSTFRPTDFWLRRFFRLAPLYYLCLVSGFLLMPWIASFGPFFGGNPPVRHQMNLVPTFGNFLLHVSFLFGFSPTLQQSTPLPDWSLALEAQFYLLFPFLAVLMARFGMVRVSAIVIVVQVAVFAAYRQAFDLFLFPTLLILKLHLFLAGMLIAASLASKRPGPVLLVAMALAVLPIPQLSVPYTIYRLMLVIVLWACVVEPASGFNARLVGLLSCPAARWLGSISYGLYLVHVIIMHIVFHYLQSIYPSGTFRLFVAAGLVTVVISVLLSYALYRLVELPGIDLGRRVLRSRRHHQRFA